MLNSYQPIFIIAGPDKILLFNKPLSEMIGERWPDAFGKSVTEIWKPIWSDIGPLIEQAYGGESFLVQDAGFLTWPSQFNDKRYYTLAFTSLQNKQGKVLGACCICNDTTDSVIRRRRVIEQIDRIGRMFDKSGSFVLAMQGPSHRIAYANQAFATLASRATVLGERMSDLYPEAVDQGVIAIADRVFRTGEGAQVQHHAYEVLQPNGSSTTRTVSMVFEPIFEFGEAPVGVFMVGEDETPIIDAEGRAETLQNELIHAGRVNAIGALGSAIAHELNQPLATITNYAAMARMALDQDGSREEVEECLAGINTAALRAGEVIRSVRELVRKGAPKRETFRLSPVAEEAVRLICLTTGQYADRKITLNIPEKLNLWGDRTQIEQVMINLLRNACESSGAKNPCAILSAKRKRSMVEITVEDFGPGIPAESLEKIFSPFQTSKDTGLGLGLSICRTIVETHGGQIRAENRPQGGALFRFSVPASMAT